MLLFIMLYIDNNVHISMTMWIKDEYGCMLISWLEYGKHGYMYWDITCYVREIYVIKERLDEINKI